MSTAGPPEGRQRSCGADSPLREALVSRSRDRGAKREGYLMNPCLKYPMRLGATRMAVLAASLWLGAAHAGLFDDDEARKAILDLRQRIEIGRAHV